MVQRMLAVVILVLGSGLVPAAAADDDTLGDLRIEHAWSRATPPGTPVGVGYLVIANDGEEADRLLGAQSPVAARVQLHRSIKRDGMSTMKHQDNGVAIPPGGQVTLEPGGYHLMLMQLDAPLETGDRVPVTLRFRRAGEVTVELAVRPLTGDD